MKIPKSIKLGGHTIPVKKVKHLVTLAEAYGTFSTGELLIRLDADMPPSHEAEVFWHECIEAIDFLFELKLEHRTIQTLGVALHQIHQSTEKANG